MRWLLCQACQRARGTRVLLADGPNQIPNTYLSLYVTHRKVLDPYQAVAVISWPKPNNLGIALIMTCLEGYCVLCCGVTWVFRRALCMAGASVAGSKLSTRFGAIRRFVARIFYLVRNMRDRAPHDSKHVMVSNDQSSFHTSSR